jgi:hypothetical protein
MVRLEQTGPGHYEVRFPTRETGAYTVGLMDYTGGRLQGLQRLGASVNYSPEFSATEPNLALLRRLAEVGGGKLLSMPGSPFAGENVNPFLHDRRKTFQPVNLFEGLLKLAILLFPLDVGIRRIQIDREEWQKAVRALRRRLFFWAGEAVPADSEESLAALLARRDSVRARQPGPAGPARTELFQPRTAREEAASPAPDTGDMPAGSKPPVATPPPATAVGPPDTASRLLAAKRRAQRKMD